jgi:hypothetical protein
MASSGMLRRVALVGTGVSEECIVSMIRATRISELIKTIGVTSKRIGVLRFIVTYNVSSLPTVVTLTMEAVRSSDISVLSRSLGVPPERRHSS